MGAYANMYLVLDTDSNISGHSTVMNRNCAMSFFYRITLSRARLRTLYLDRKSLNKYKIYDKYHNLHIKYSL